MTEDANRAAWLQQARSYLRDADPVLARLVDERPLMPPPGGLPSATRSCRCQAVHVLSTARNHHDPVTAFHLAGGYPGPVAKIRTAEWSTQ